MIKKIKKWIYIVIAAFVIIFMLNATYSIWDIFRTLNGYNDDKMKYYELSMYPCSGYEKIYIYAKASVIPSFVPQDLIIIKKSDGKNSVWYGGLLLNFKIFHWLTAFTSKEYRKLHEEKYWINNKDLEHFLKKHGFVKIN